LPVFGQPISNAGFGNAGGEDKFLQYFERARMERPNNGQGVEFGLLGIELERAGLIHRAEPPGRFYATVECSGCPPPNVDGTSRGGFGETCEAAYTAARHACDEIACTGATTDKGCIEIGAQ
jgi:hypothetical protein